MRQQEQYADSTASAFLTSQVQHMSAQRAEYKSSGNFEERLEAFTPERDPFVNLKPEGQWRWERDGSKMSNPTVPHMFNQGQGGDIPRSYYQSQRPDPKLALQNQGNNDSRSQPQEEDMDIGYEDNPLPQTFEALEKKFHDEIMKLAKEQNDAEDAENARHREKINAINAQYEEQLAALRVRHSSHREEFLQRQSHARQQWLQQAMMDPNPNIGKATADAHGYAVMASGAKGEVERGYTATDQFDSYRERAGFLGGGRDHVFEAARGPYPGGRVYDTGSRYH